jgi:cytochrome c oxidase subunit 4
MTDATLAHDEHAHDEGAVHAHIASTRFYIGIFSTLVMLTLLTITVSYVHLGPLNLVVAILIASTKAALVVMFFMHLRYETKFNILVFVCSLAFIGVFFAYTINDTGRRGDLDLEDGTKVLPSNGEIAPGGIPEKPAATGEGPGMGHAPGIEPGKGEPAKAGEKLAPAPGPKSVIAVPEQH